VVFCSCSTRKKYLRAQQIAPHILGAMQRKVHFCTQRNRETIAWFTLCENSGIICSILTTERGMVEFSERTQANMDVVLEEVCAELPNGGDHESRKFIAEQLIQCARSGRTTLGELMYAARRAIVQLERNRRSAS
jgi:hypothetical protein